MDMPTYDVAGCEYSPKSFACVGHGGGWWSVVSFSMVEQFTYEIHLGVILTTNISINAYFVTL